LVSAGYAAVRFATESAEAFKTFDNSMREIFTLMPGTSAVQASHERRHAGRG
jgi:hypothetical protein